jgi:hypothetical protein
MTSYSSRAFLPYPDATDPVTSYPTLGANLAGRLDYLPNRNRVMNGEYLVAQRSAGGGVSTGTYVADRWRIDFDGAAGTRLASLIKFANGTSVGGTQFRQYHSWNITSAGTATTQRVGQRIEDVRTLAGENIALSFYASSSAAKTVTVKAVQYFGTGGTPSTSVTTTLGTASTTTTWTRFVYTATLPNLSGKTIGSNLDSYLEIHFDYGSQIGTMNLVGVQLENNTNATPYERVSEGDELARCRRYYYEIVENNVTGADPFGVGVKDATTTAQIWTAFPVTMRTAPAFSSSQTLGDFGFYDAGFVNRNTTALPTMPAGFTYGARILLTASTGTSASGTGTMGYLSFTGSPPWLGFSAEL